MPLIKDNPWLISQLLQSVADEESKRELLKKGQVTPENKASAEGLKAMLVNLRNQITPSKPDPNRVGQVDSALSLSSNHMDSMGDMVTWLATNKVTMGDQIIVYPGNIARPSEEYGYFKIEPGTEIIIPLAKQDRNVVAYWINPTALKGYLMSLQAAKTLDATARQAVYEEMSRTVWDDCPWIFLYHQQDIYGLRDKVKGFKPTSEGGVRLEATEVAS